MTASKQDRELMWKKARASSCSIVLIAMCVALLGGCAQRPSAAERNKATVQRFMSAFIVPSEEEAMTIVEDIVTEDFFFDDPPLPEQVRGLEGVKKWVRGERALGPKPPDGSQREFIDVMLADDKYVMVQKHLPGGDMFAGDDGREIELMGLKGKPTGKKMESTTVLDVYYFTAEGKLSKIVSRYDSLAVLSGMGFMPSLEEIEQLKARAAQCGCAAEQDQSQEPAAR